MNSSLNDVNVQLDLMDADHAIADLTNDAIVMDDNRAETADCQPIIIDMDDISLQLHVEGFDTISPAIPPTSPSPLGTLSNMTNFDGIDHAPSESSSVISIRIPSPFRQQQADCFQNPVNVFDVDDEILEVKGSEVSSVLIESSDDDDGFRDSLLLKLRAFASEARVSRRHMNTLMEILRDHGVAQFPQDYRTLLNECAILDRLSLRADPFAQRSTVLETLVCGYCWLASFDDVAIKNAVTCSHCQVATVRCPRPMCYTRCILISSLGGRSVSSLIFCLYCEKGSESTLARRTFRFPLANYIKSAFSRLDFAQSAMAPFKGFCALTKSNPAQPHFSLACVPDWYKTWKEHMESQTFASEFWDGKLFRDDPIWTNHGPRSLMFVISLDWFPPFKQGDYTIGVFTVSPANLACADRAKRINTWVLAIIEGPNEPTHVIECLRPCFEEIREFASRGVEVFDAATNKSLRVFISAPVVSADVPACAKLGNLYGHSSYFPCISCEYQGVVCGCKQNKKDIGAPARWDNRSFRPQYDKAKNLLSGDARRTLHKGEHIAFVDTEVLLPHHLRSEQVHIAGLKDITDLLERETNQALVDRVRKKVRSNGPSALSLLLPHHFNFTTGFSIDAMHTVLKGVVLRLWIATVGDKYKKKWYNVQYYASGLKVLKHRFSLFKFPIGFPSANKMVARRHSLKAEELYTIVRICGPFVFNNIVPKSVVVVWALFTKIFSNLLHYHVSKPWMHAATGLRALLKEAFEKYIDVFGPCMMPSNFHRILHCWLDFRHWGPLRCHWAFPYERLYGALCATSRMQNRAQVTMSIVNSMHLIYLNGDVTDRDSPGRILSCHPPNVDVQALDVITLINAGYNWVHTFYLSHSRRWHMNEFLVSLTAGSSLSPDCFFIIVGIISPPTCGRNKTSLQQDDKTAINAFFVLRRVLGLRQKKFFHKSATFFCLYKETVNSGNHLGMQLLYPVSTFLTPTNAICGVVQYHVSNDHVILIPSFGLINWI